MMEQVMHRAVLHEMLHAMHRAMHHASRNAALVSIAAWRPPGPGQRCHRFLPRICICQPLVRSVSACRNMPVVRVRARVRARVGVGVGVRVRVSVSACRNTPVE